MGDSVIRKTDSKNGLMRKKNTGKKLPQRHKNAGIGCNKRLSSLPPRTWMWLWYGCICRLGALLNLVSMFMFLSFWREGEKIPRVRIGS